MKLYYVYILRCKDNSLYTGITNDLERRINEHNEGKLNDSYTYSRRPVALEFFQDFTEPTQAIYFEEKLKVGQNRKKKRLSREITICFKPGQNAEMLQIQNIR
jgi:putative endonuclease